MCWHHQHIFIFLPSYFEIIIKFAIFAAKSTVMNTIIVKSKKKSPKLSVEERRILYASLPAGNKYVEAARKHAGEIWVKDPMLLL